MTEDKRDPGAKPPPASGRSFVVTGTGGLGLETALALACAGGEVIVAGRNPQKGATAVERIVRAAPEAKVAFEPLDLAELASIARFAERLADRRSSIDVLINNAGVMSPPARTLTADGFEAQFGVNHLGHFALTAMLLPLLLAGDRPRVVSLTSNAHRVGGMDFADLQGERRYRPGLAYCHSKLAQAMFAVELQRRADQRGWGLKSLAVHPGFAATDIFANGLGRGSFTDLLGSRLIAPLFGHSAEAGARSIVHAATAPDVSGGELYGPRGFLEMRGDPGVCKYSPVAVDPAAAARLWEISEALTGVRFDAVVEVAA